ncbi:toll/interleukin-1 receptor-like protein [Neltuma alba]|uniref:toll/interleukin-1 receptor-like protein n=1 Tax=Neltuma alba TaxID=207710 RepID=UPI0010A44388|nr:toll/interleukin-1 receptor-like protein [Prosopis alba]
MATDQEASSSSSSNSNLTRRTCRYDVFLSFRGEDTRVNFTEYLCRLLVRSGLRVFKDDTGLRRGEIISQELLQAIDESRSAIVILSKSYASSSWCLDELEHIPASRNKLGQIVFPIFYYVDPSDVRHQRGNFGQAFTRLEDKFQRDQSKVQTWRDSLTEVAHLAGLASGQYGCEAELVDNVVEHLRDRLRSDLPPVSEVTH